MKHHLVQLPGVEIHAVEQGSGPLVLLVHGFPELWYSWRHQLPALAEAGYRAVAIDVRGYGRSSAPDDVDAYRMRELVADNVGVVRALGADTAAIVGHDWGSPIAANSALLEPDVFTAVALLSVPYTPRNGMRPTDAFAMAGGDEEFYVSYFQEPGRAEREIDPDVRGWLRGFVTSNRLHGRAGRAAEGSLRRRPGPALVRPRRLRGRVRAHGAHRRAQPLPQRRPRLGGPRSARRRAGPAAVDLHRRRAGPLDDVAQGRHRRARPHAPRPRLAAHPRRRRALSAAGGSGDREPAADRLAARRGPRWRLSPSALAGPFGPI